MSSVIIVFASMTGNTEEMAELVADGVRAAGIEPVLKSVVDANASELEKYDGVLLGAYTWGDGDLPDEFLDFYEEMDDIQLAGRKAAVFGSADSSYSQYGAAVDTLIAKLKEQGADVVQEGLKVELNPSGDEKEVCRAFGRKLAEALA
ncbi:flavodoxin [Paenibacillus validus]|uniref:Flavodoxin n=1 Tax=Paenibacillus validus TaxID=44253 RepID=A0A7X3CU12_9BACL|nr:MULTISPECIES: flavodoxin [Paenibacillus]MED4601980.1 flavodoxin [Paenibacillus validus]MED4608023.1 flavodoxin [Paenibacillus validus]MUG71589.1 flavodoxin [Paenibacillus validus]